MPLPGQALSSCERVALAARIRHHGSLHSGLRNRDRICKLLMSPGIDSEASILPAYVGWRAGTTNKVAVLARQARNRFLGSLKIYKHELRIYMVLHGIELLDPNQETYSKCVPYPLPMSGSSCYNITQILKMVNVKTSKKTFFGRFRFISMEKLSLTVRDG